jgi:hypothetical protein
MRLFVLIFFASVLATGCGAGAPQTKSIPPDTTKRVPDPPEIRNKPGEAKPEGDTAKPAP